MAKDRRNKRPAGSQVNLTAMSGKSSGSRQPASRTGGTASSSAVARQRTTGKKSTGRKILLALTAVLVVVSIALVFAVFNILFGSNGSGKWPVTSDYKTTPEAYADKVAYYLVGVLGENADSDMMALSVICHDKKKGTMNIMELPRQTYLGNSGTWATQTVAGVWANPAPLNWCDHCRRQVFEPEITDGKHNVRGCDTPITQKTGSSVENLMKVCNEYLGLPVDNYFIMPQQALVKLVNLVGGIDVELEAAMKVEDIKYKAGVQTVDGAAALAYMTPSKDSVSVELKTMKNRRQVLLALFDRLRKASAEELDENVIGPLQYGSTPIRTTMDSDEIIALLKELASVDAGKVTLVTMPGEATTQEKVSLFSAHTGELVELLNDRFNPYGQEISASDILAQQIDNDEASDLQEQTMSKAMTPQSAS